MGKPTRMAYGEMLAKLGEQNPRVVVMDADLAKSTQAQMFGDRFPDRFFNVGIQESNMAGIAAGFALSGFYPFISSFAGFLVCKTFDQARVSIAYPGLNVKFVGSHGGISIGEDGPSQMAIEDLALMLALPGFTVLVPADEHATRALFPRFAESDGPGYLRLCRPPAPLVYDPEPPLTLGEAHVVREGTDVSVFAVGLLLAEALDAAEELDREGISVEVIDFHTLRPVDEETILHSVRKTGRAVTCEEHLLGGGLSAVISRVIAERHPVPMTFVGLDNTYAESGSPYGLLEHYGLTCPGIVQAIRKLL